MALFQSASWTQKCHRQHLFVNSNFIYTAAASATFTFIWKLLLIQRAVWMFVVGRTTCNLKNWQASSSLQVKFRYICYWMHVMWPSPSEQTARLIKTLPLLALSALPYLSFYNFTFTVENTIQDSLLWKLYQYALQARPKVFFFFFSLPSNSMFFYN